MYTGSSISFKKAIGKLHLWLGLPTGLVVFIVAITGCLYCFKEEINTLYDDYKYVESQDVPMLTPSEAYNIADNHEKLPDRHIHSANYGAKNEALEVVFYETDPEFYQIAYLNPYSGEFIKLIDLESGFFHFLLDGHMNLWMGSFGQKIVAYGTLIFLVILLSGLILWWPRNRKVAKKRTWFSWSQRSRWKRKNYDLHNILGFYASAVAALLAITGLVMALNWFAEGFYRVTGGDKSAMFTWPENVSETAVEDAGEKPIDILWKRMMNEYPEGTVVEMHYPPTEDAAIYAYMKLSEGTYWDSDYRYFDSRTLEEIEPGHVYGKLEKATTADIFHRMSYDIHVGAIGGIAGKIIVFLASLIVGTLPITGTFIWWGRRQKSSAQLKRKRQRRKKMEAAA